MMRFLMVFVGDFDLSASQVCRRWVMNTSPRMTDENAANFMHFVGVASIYRCWGQCVGTVVSHGRVNLRFQAI